MKAYKVNYNEKNKVFYLGEFEVAYEGDISYMGETNLRGEENLYNCHKDIMDKHIESLNEDLRIGELVVFKCKVCGKYYMMDYDERQWYKDKGWSLPKKCSACRAEARKNV